MQFMQINHLIKNSGAQRILVSALMEKYVEDVFMEKLIHPRKSIK